MWPTIFAFPLDAFDMNRFVNTRNVSKSPTQGSSTENLLLLVLSYQGPRRGRGWGGGALAPTFVPYKMKIKQSSNKL